MLDVTSDLWTRVQRRDASADGLFVYAVASTGIYCRPSCPSRRPRRDRVEFFPTGAMAAATGYRACRRCRPDEPRPLPAPAARVRRGCEAIARAPARPWTTGRIAAAAGSSVSQLQRAFRDVLGVSPRDYVAACRHRRFLDRLRENGRVTPAVFEAGYGSSGRAYEAQAGRGMTPATYAKGGRGATIEWRAAASPVGAIVVAATTTGVCLVAVVGRVAEARAAVVREFPHAVVPPRPSERLRSFVAVARAVASAQPMTTDVPADIRGTAFQWTVWRALKTIPIGRTLTYAELAVKIGAPNAVRAVARACATNPLALVVPCHRVIGRDGALRGYRWGVDTKARLLQQERSATSAGV